MAPHPGPYADDPLERKPTPSPGISLVRCGFKVGNEGLEMQRHEQAEKRRNGAHSTKIRSESDLGPMGGVNRLMPHKGIEGIDVDDTPGGNP